MQVQPSTLLRCPHMSMSLFFLPSELGTQPFQVHETCGIQCKPSRQLSAQLSFQMCTQFTACQCCCCTLGSLHVSHEAKMARKLRHKSIHKSWNGDHPLTSLSWKSVDQEYCLTTRAAFNAGQKPMSSFSQALGNIRRFLLKWTLSNKTLIVSRGT